MSNKSVAIKINQDKLLANLQYSFSNNTTLLGELMQNSRRAGATKVLLESVDETTLRIIDDGKGIDDFQNLFSVAESAWEADISKNERPFGMGFLSCLYQAEKIHIESNGQYIEGKTSEVLAGESLNIKDMAIKSDKTYTVVSLFGIKLTSDDVAKALTKLAEGFAIPVFYNGAELERANAESNKVLTHVPGVGNIYRHEVEKSIHGFQSQIARMVIYLQGLPVYDNRPWDNAGHNVVHLDSSLFFARMPDRDKLIDENIALEKVNNALNQLNLVNLLKLKAELSQKDFAVKNIMSYALCIKGGLEVISQKDVNISNLFYGKISSAQPSCTSYDETLEFEFKDYSVSFDDVESGGVNFCRADSMYEQDDDNCPAAWIFARKMDWLMLNMASTENSNDLEKNHWVNAFTHYLNNSNISVEINGLGKTGFISLDYCGADIQLCESYTITYTDANGNQHVCTVDDEPILSNNEVLIIPSASRNFGEAAVAQISSYTNEHDHHDEDTHCKDAKALELYVDMLRSGDEISALQAMLNSVNLYEYKEFIGSKYEMTLDEHCRVVLTKTSA